MNIIELSNYMDQEFQEIKKIERDLIAICERIDVTLIRLQENMEEQKHRIKQIEENTQNILDGGYDGK